MLDGIHFSYREGYCKPNNCDGNTVANTLLEDTYIRCNRRLKPERQKLIKDMPRGDKLSSKRARQWSSSYWAFWRDLTQSCGSESYKTLQNPWSEHGLCLSTLSSICISAGFHLLGQDQWQLILSEVHAQFCLLVIHGCKVWPSAGPLAQSVCTWTISLNCNKKNIPVCFVEAL